MSLFKGVLLPDSCIYSLVPFLGYYIRSRDEVSCLSRVNTGTCSITSFKPNLRHKNILMARATVHQFECSYCDKMFARKRNLMLHEQIHIGEKAFRCSHCESKFFLQVSLERHMVIHTKEKPFKCPHCESKFAIKSNFTRHVQRHTGEKPFNCESKFSDVFALAKHITGEKTFNCPHCIEVLHHCIWYF